MEVRFTVGKVEQNTKGCNPVLSGRTSRLADHLSSLHYSGNIRNVNSNQLDLDLDERLCAVLEGSGWGCDRNPRLDTAALAEDWGRPTADAILTYPSGGGDRVVIEIEKSNKKTIWFDFIKLWMFIDAGQASVGLILCPVKYVHRHDVWNLYDEACRYKRYFHRFAGVPSAKLNLIGIVGFQQRIVVNGGNRLWDIRELTRVKQEFNKGISSG